MTGKPLPNVYDDRVLARDLRGTPDPVVQAQAALPHGDDIFRIETVKLNIDGSEFAKILDGLLRAIAIEVSALAHSIPSVTKDEDDITLDDVVDKFKGDVSAALSVLCRGDASSICVNRTLRDGVNTKRKLVVKFSAEMQEVYDEDDDGQDTDDFQ